MPFGPQFPFVTSHNLFHTFDIASFFGVEGEQYGDHRQHSRLQHASLYAVVWEGEIKTLFSLS